MSNAIIITVSLKNSNSNPPKLKLKDSLGDDPGNDNLTTEVSTGDIITWVPDYSSGISSLTGITKKPDSDYDLLNQDPLKDSSGNYVGSVVSTSPKKGAIETYSIGFTIDGDSASYSDDPKLKINN
ncbi:hypothetical protein [Mangrovimonas sp. DI 80]|uniref:hypothetical protein n=1 Tax=Mangrovimonas sp. DI 80 TaxID=1779330 RepID=UPI000976C3F0|nr:hypothetical protein [Mangrovimonas sp. DI 80]OMP30756.1 hypothetical protein BKM32_11000 [Mangrovimonas sp. DI 80]